MSTTTLRIGTRGSELALWQANHTADQLRARGHSVSVEIIRTTGDRMQDPAFKAPATFDDGSPLDAKGIFIKEIEDALAAGRIDVAVHSLKDLPDAISPALHPRRHPRARRRPRRLRLRELLGPAHAAHGRAHRHHLAAPQGHAPRPSP